MKKIDLSLIKQMESHTHKFDNVISLSQGGLKISGMNDQVKEHIKYLVDHQEHIEYYGDPRGIPSLRTAIAHAQSTQYNTTILPDNVLVTHGCCGALSVLLLSILEEGDNVILPEPTYPTYANLVHIARATPTFVSLFDDTDTINWEYTADQIKNNTTDKTKIILLSNPGNPTGSLIPKHVLEELIDWCTTHEIYLISDEVYEDYIYRPPFTSATSYTPSSPWVIKLGSFSKNYALSGWRVGFAILPSHLFDQAYAVQDALIVCPNVTAQHVALYSLQHPEILEHNIAYVTDNMKLTKQMLQPLFDNGTIEGDVPEAGFFFFVKINTHDVVQTCRELINQAQVSIVPGLAFGPSGHNHVRLCFAREKQYLKTGLERFINFWNK